MPFALVETLRVHWPVTVTRPSETSPGEVVKETFTGLFEVLGAEDARAHDERYLALPIDQRRDHENDLLKRVLVGWDGVVAGGSPVPFTPDNLALALRFPWFPAGVYAAYREIMSGEKARLGN